MKNKRGLSALAWIIIAIVVIAIVVGVYFIAFKQYPIGLEQGSQAAGSIPQPPALPN